MTDPSAQPYTFSALNQSEREARALLRYIGTDLIDPNPRQPRKVLDPVSQRELVESIRDRGILQPLLVRRKKGSRFELIAGQRRLAAANEIGLVRVPAMVLHTEDSNDALTLVDSLLENVQREALSDLEEGETFLLLQREYSWTQEQIAHHLHKERTYVAHRMRVAQQLTPTTKEIILEARMQSEENENVSRDTFSYSVNRALASLPPEMQEEVARDLATHPHTAREAQAIVRRLRQQQGKGSPLVATGDVNLGDLAITRLIADLSAQKPPLRLVAARQQVLEALRRDIARFPELREQSSKNVTG